jgi:hypothetical protein
MTVRWVRSEGAGNGNFDTAVEDFADADTTGFGLEWTSWATLATLEDGGGLFEDPVEL